MYSPTSKRVLAGAGLGRLGGRMPEHATTVVTDILAGLDYPMLIVTAVAGGERSGCLVGFAAQCSIDPQRLMVWISRANHTAGIASRSQALGVHFPSRAQGDLAALFGAETGDHTDKFRRCRWHDGPLGVPLLDDCQRWVVGTILRRDDTGDHVGHLLEPVASGSGPWEGQLGYQAVRDLHPGHPA
jgi:flavin reductase (DIM6/NTAB) family NADH-FMN oxidoreductase RutF